MQWPDPKDYGLPFVEITPLRSKAVVLEKAVGNLPTQSDVKSETEPEIEIPAVQEQLVLSSEPSENSELQAEKVNAAPSVSRPEEEKKSAAWVWAVILIGLGIVAVIIWQIQSRTDSSTSQADFEIRKEPVKESVPIAVATSPESTTTDQNQIAANQDSIQPVTISNPNISKPAETGTTIANTATGKLIRVENKAERPQYFIIVGSLPNEEMALEEVNQYFGRSPEIYLISPIDGGKNYRLALSKFDSFKMAAAKLEEIKSQYTEELWILKY